MARMSEARNRSLIYCITRSRFTRVGSSSRIGSLSSQFSIPLSSRFSPRFTARITRRAPPPDEGTRRFALRSLARERDTVMHQAEWTFVTWLEIPAEFTITRYVMGTRPWHARTYTYRYTRDDNDDSSAKYQRESHNRYF